MLCERPLRSRPPPDNRRYVRLGCKMAVFAYSEWIMETSFRERV